MLSFLLCHFFQCFANSAKFPSVTKGDKEKFFTRARYRMGFRDEKLILLISETMNHGYNTVACILTGCSVVITKPD